jgi:hypothetical protein
MKSNFKSKSPSRPDHTKLPDPLTLPQPPALPLPITLANTQPLPGASLDTQSLLRDLLERNLPPAVLRKL